MARRDQHSDPPATNAAPGPAPAGFGAQPAAHWLKRFGDHAKLELAEGEEPRFDPADVVAAVRTLQALPETNPELFAVLAKKGLDRELFAAAGTFADQLEQADALAPDDLRRGILITPPAGGADGDRAGRAVDDALIAAFARATAGRRAATAAHSAGTTEQPREIIGRPGGAAGRRQAPTDSVRESPNSVRESPNSAQESPNSAREPPNRTPRPPAGGPDSRERHSRPRRPRVIFAHDGAPGAILRRSDDVLRCSAVRRSSRGRRRAAPARRAVRDRRAPATGSRPARRPSPPAATAPAPGAPRGAGARGRARDRRPRGGCARSPTDRSTDRARR